MDSSTDSNRFQTILRFFGLLLVVLMVGCSIYLRSKNYLNNYSLFIDEANLGCNLAERSIGGFWRDLDYSQYAPPIFMVLTKLVCWIGGYHEYTLRLIPMLCSFAALGLLFVLGRRLKADFFAIGVVLGIVGMSYWTILLSYSFKQYFLDLVIALGLTLYTIKRDHTRFFETKELLIWAVLGSILVWTSMPVVYTMAAIGAYFALQAYEKGDFMKWVPRFALPVVCWVANFIAYFLLLLHADASETYLQNYHKMYFLSPVFWTNEGVLHNWSVLHQIVSFYVTDYLFVQLLLYVCYGIGCAYIWRKRKELLVLLVLPFVLALLSSMAGYYSLIGRLVLFTFPIQVLIAGLGLQQLLNARSYLSKGIAIAIGCSFIYFLNGWIFLFKGYGIVFESTRESIAYIAERRQPEEHLVTIYQSLPAMRFYTQHYKYKDRFAACIPYEAQLNDESILPTLEQAIDSAPAQKAWFLLGHLGAEDAQQRLAPVEQALHIIILDRHEAWNTRAIQAARNSAAQ